MCVCELWLDCQAGDLRTVRCLLLDDYVDYVQKCVFMCLCNCAKSVRLSVSCISCVYGVCACSMVQVGDPSLA